MKYVLRILMLDFLSKQDAQFLWIREVRFYEWNINTRRHLNSNLICVNHVKNI